MTTHQPGWYREWFGAEYLALYPHRDEAEARAAVDLVAREFPHPQGPVLDLACGAGRHLSHFESRNIKGVGLDLSAPLLRRAKARANSPLVRGDMRMLPFRESRFHWVVNFFTSFGYFCDVTEDTLVLREIHRVLRPGGWFALDFLNAPRVKANLVPRDENELDGRRVVQERRLEEQGRVVAKAIRIFEGDDPEPRETYHERVRLYTPDELRQMLETAGFQPEKSYGDYSGTPLTDQSPRCIQLGRSR